MGQREAPAARHDVRRVSYTHPWVTERSWWDLRLLQQTIWQIWDLGKGVEVSRPMVSRNKGLTRIHLIFK